MKTIYELNEKDITTLVAERFDIGTECVQVSYDNTTTNYGILETTKPTIKIQITMDKDIDEVWFWILDFMVKGDVLWIKEYIKSG